MVIAIQYPQYLYTLVTSEAKQDSNGSWTSGSSAVWVFKGMCREETNGKGHTIVSSGGETVAFASLIQIPKGTPRINEGTEIIVTREKISLPKNLLNNDFVRQAKITGLIVAKGKCMKYDFGRLHCRLWI
jgi:hypothetical protein